MISVIEYAIVNLGAPATLRATTPSLDFTPPPAWYDLDTDRAHAASASRVLLRSETPTPPFVSNVAIQYFNLDTTQVIRLSEIDTTLDIAALGGATILGHETEYDGYLCSDEGIYTAADNNLRVRRSQLSYQTPDGSAALTIFTATTTLARWDTVETEIKEMEHQWLTTTIPTSGVN
ncbi:acetyltransferase [Gordonia sp. HNM0687]|uniref:Acetyltransferase n=1 Tax=Gordonia mangrovi TaxID=2665643 RepID=A0A6L7GPT8_9ACTN|nr:acetyltransferase [Gordonia mangrovi]MXP21896.1 acetyltransferase [Gordonia mangrovi]UVF76265.1 acetyltransferase [Gordonia mangrovi]